jgi:hypothetical protein
MAAEKVSLAVSVGEEMWRTGGVNTEDGETSGGLGGVVVD